MKNTISIFLEEQDNYTNPYNKKRLHPDLLSYILDEQKGIPFRNKIEFEIYNNHKLTEQEQNEFVEILRSNLNEDAKETLLQTTLIQIRACILIIVGIICILLSLFISRQSTSLISELLLILGWVGVWEATYMLLFDNVHISIKRKRYKKLVNAKVYFHEEK